MESADSANSSGNPSGRVGTSGSCPLCAGKDREDYRSRNGARLEYVHSASMRRNALRAAAPAWLGIQTGGPVSMYEDEQQRQISAKTRFINSLTAFRPNGTLPVAGWKIHT